MPQSILLSIARIYSNNAMEDNRERKTGRIHKIIVDQDACIGAVSCVVVAPGVFQMNDEQKAYIVDPEGADDDTLLLAAQSCPVLAIKLFDEEGNQIFPEN